MFWAPWARAVGEIFVAYTQPCLRVVIWWCADSPIVMWGLCFGKVGEVISCLVGPVRGYRQTGPQCLPTPAVSVSCIYAAIVCAGGLGSVLSGVIILSYLVSCVNASMLPLILLLLSFLSS
jgi:hypothetical protein